MDLFSVQVKKTEAIVLKTSKIPKGIIGAVLDVSFSEEWVGLEKTAVFRCGKTTKDVVGFEGRVVLPHELTRKVGVPIEFGVYGIDVNGDVAIPTIWATLGTVLDAADPSEDYSADPTLPVWVNLSESVKKMATDITDLQNNKLPSVTEEDNGKFLQAVDEAWSAVDVVPQVESIVDSRIDSKFVSCTQEEYEAWEEAGTIDATKYYMIVGDSV